MSLTIKVNALFCSGATSLCSTCLEIDQSFFNKSRNFIKEALRGVYLRPSYYLMEADTRLQNIEWSSGEQECRQIFLSHLFYNRDLTIEIQYKASSTDSAVLFSVSRNTAVGLIIQNSHLEIVLSRIVNDTGLTVEGKSRNQVTLVYKQSSRKITVYYINWHYSLKFPPWITFFEPLGTFVVEE